MANHPSALKRARQSEKRRIRNKAALSAMKKVVRKVDAAFSTGNTTSTKTALQKATVVLYKSASKGIIPKKRASRKVSRLTLKVNKLPKEGPVSI